MKDFALQENALQKFIDRRWHPIEEVCCWKLEALWFGECDDDSLGQISKFILGMSHENSILSFKIQFNRINPRTHDVEWLTWNVT
jgi:hypothetical protein